MNNRFRALASVVLALGLPGCLGNQHPTSPVAFSQRAQFSVSHDRSAFEAASGRLAEIDFENLPTDGSVNNPLRIAGVRFRDPHRLQIRYCSSPTCQTDPDNPFGEGNIQLFLNPGGTIDFLPRTRSVLLIIEGIGDNPFQLRVTDAERATHIIDGVGVYFGAASVGVMSSTGISRIEVVSVGGTGGPLGISSMLFGQGGRPFRQLIAERTRPSF